MARPHLSLLLCLAASMGCDVATGLSDLTFDLPNGAGGGGGIGPTDLCSVSTAHHWSGQGSDVARGIHVDGGDVVVVGDFQGAIDIGEIALSAPSTDGFIAHIASDGAVGAIALGAGDAGAVRSVTSDGGSWLVTGNGPPTACEGGDDHAFLAALQVPELALGDCIATENANGNMRLFDVALAGGAAWLVGGSDNGVTLEEEVLGPGPFVARVTVGDLAVESAFSADDLVDTNLGRPAVAARQGDSPYVALVGDGNGIFDGSIPAPPSADDLSTFLVVSDASPTGDTDVLARIGGQGEQLPYDVAVAHDGGAVVVGSYQGRIDFSGDEEGSLTPAPRSQVVLGGFVAKYDAAGGLQWHALFDAPSTDDEVVSVAVASTGDVFVTGRLGPDHGVDEIECDRPLGSAPQLFVARLDPDGSLVWLRHFGSTGTGTSSGQGIALSDDENRLWVASTFAGTLDLGSETLDSTSGAADVLVLALPSTL